MSRRRVAALVLLILTGPLVALAQRGGRLFGGFDSRWGQAANAGTDGRFTFARVEYARYGGWAADYPTMERNLTLILREITSMRPHETEATSIHSTTPSCSSIPSPTCPSRATGFRTRPRSGVSATTCRKAASSSSTISTFRTSGAVFEVRCGACCPTRESSGWSVSHPIFNTLLSDRVARGAVPGPTGRAGADGRVLGHSRGQRSTPAADRRHQLQHRHRRLRGMVGGRTSTTRLPTNEAYKFMINYIVYGLTH